MRLDECGVPEAALRMGFVFLISNKYSGYQFKSEQSEERRLFGKRYISCQAYCKAELS